MNQRSAFGLGVALLASACITLASGCAPTTQIVQEKMVIAPGIVVLSAPRSDTTVSITHTCSCPFYWHASLRKTVPWLTLGPNFPTTLTSDHAAIPLSIDRTKLATTDSTVILISSNAYGVDSILVVANK